MTWIQSKFSLKQFRLVLALCVGLASGLAANFLKWFIHFVEHLLTSNFPIAHSNPLYLLYPVVGILLSALFIKYIVRDNIGHGVTKILYSISRNQGYLRDHNTWSSMVASGITIGFGGSVGSESPIVLTGSAIGSRIGRWFDMDHHTLMLLVGCGASGAVAGVFKAPLAGLVFTIEVLMIDLTMSSLVPLLIATTSATCVSYILTGRDAMFNFDLSDPFIVEHVPAIIVLGVACGLVGLYFTRVTNRIERIFSRYSNLYARWAVGATMLAVLIYLFPPLFGEGYSTISTLVNSQHLGNANELMYHSLFYGHDQFLLIFLLLIVLVKVVASTATTSGGGCGGTFAPSLFLGCISGFIFASVWNMFAPESLTLSPANACLYGMSGVMSAVFHAPLMGIFLIAELTGGYTLLVPLMIVAAISFLTIHTFEPHSIYTTRLARRGELLTHHKDQSVLTLMNLADVTDKSRPVLQPEMKMGKMLQLISTSKRLHFAVCAPDGKLLGVVNINSIRHLIFRSELYNTFSVNALMQDPHAILSTDDSMAEIMDKFQTNDAGTLPVVDGNGLYVGFVSRARLYSVYREILKDFSEE